MVSEGSPLVCQKFVLGSLRLFTSFGHRKGAMVDFWLPR